MTQQKRLDKVASALTPKQAALLWLQEARQHGSIEGLSRAYQGRPVGDYPLSVLYRQMEQSVRDGMKGEKREHIGAAIEQAQRDVTFLFKLVTVLNGDVAAEARFWSLGLLHAKSQLLALVERLQLDHDASRAWAETCELLPYPLEPETAAALAALEAQWVEPWSLWEESSQVQDWVTTAYVAEGRQRLPFWASYARPDAPPPPVGIPVPTLEELRPLFATEQAFQQWLASEDYRYGLADVADTDFLARCAAVDAALAERLKDGSLTEGHVLHLPTVPYSFLHWVPLVDGMWVDATVLELAEWGALLQKQGYVYRDPDDNAPLAMDRIGQEVEGAFVAADAATLSALQDAARQRLATWPGRSNVIGDRHYLHLDDYQAWRGRALKGKLTRETGISAASWNPFASGGGTLAGVPFRPLRPWFAGQPHTVVAPGDLAEATQRRATLLARLRRWTLHDFDRELGYFSRPAPVTGQTFTQQAAVWRSLALQLGGAVHTLDAAVQAITDRYFDGADPLLPEVRAQLGRYPDAWRALLGVWNDVVAPAFRLPGDAHQQPGELAVEELREAGQREAEERTILLVDQAKAQALLVMCDVNAAAEVMAKHVV